MSTRTTQPRRSVLMGVLRISAPPLVLACLAGVVLTAVGNPTPFGEHGWSFRDVGQHLLVFGGLLFVVLLWGGVYLEVREASRGMPGLRVVDGPTLTPERAEKLHATERSLTALGFQQCEWVMLDDFGETHVSAWRHESLQTAAFITTFPDGGMPRVRFVRWFPSGAVLASTTRAIDLSYPPPQGIYVQAWKGATVEELWAWHLEAESVFPDATATAVAPEFASPRELFVAVAKRWSSHRRRDRTWLLAVEPFGEFWRIYHLNRMPLRRQFELGWSNPFWQ